jgi:carboxyl-terminal processing protease
MTAGDRIESVDGVPAPHLTVGLLEKTLGDDRPDRLRIIPAASTDTLSLVLKDSSEGWATAPWPGDLSGRVGYVRVTWFAPGAARQLRKVIESLIREGADAVIIDLRGNPGGSFAQAVDAAGLFLDQGATVARLRMKKRVEPVKTDRRPPFPNLRLALLVDRGTAGSAEMMAAALRERGRAALLGTRTWGHGSIQSFFRIEKNRDLCLRLTTAYLATSAGNGIEPSATGETGGVAPDIVVETEDEPGAVRRLKLGRMFHRFVQERCDRSDRPVSPGRLPEGLADRFYRYLLENDFEYRTGELERARENIENCLLYELAERFNGAAGRWRLELAGDPVYDRAVADLSS